MTDFFFNIQPMQPAERLQRIFSDARNSVVEMETHPIDLVEYEFLAGGEIFRWAGGVAIADHYALPGRKWPARPELLARSVG
jgi:hypothetical protein